MTKYTVASRRGATIEEKKTNPVWRGIGCVMLLVVPVMSYAAALMLVQYAVDQDWPVPYQLMGLPVLPAWMHQVSGLSSVAGFIESQQNLWAILLMTVFFIVLLGAIISAIYAIVYPMVSPPRLGPYDAPAPKVAVKRYRR